MIVLLRLVNGELRCDAYDATIPLPEGMLLVSCTELSAEEQALLERLIADVYRVRVPWAELSSVSLVLSPPAEAKKEFIFADTLRLTSLVELEFLLEAQVAVFLSSRLLVTVFSSTSAHGHAFFEPSLLVKPLLRRFQLRGVLHFFDVLEEAFMLMTRLCEQTATAHSRAIAQVTESALHGNNARRSAKAICCSLGHTDATNSGREYLRHEL